jgi:hypothetical protein
MKDALDNITDDGNIILQAASIEEMQFSKWIKDTKIALIVNFGPASQEISYFDWLISANQDENELYNWLRAAVALITAFKNAHFGKPFRKAIPSSKLRLAITDCARRVDQQGYTTSAFLLVGIVLDDTLRELAHKSAVNNDVSASDLSYRLFRAEVINKEQWKEISHVLNLLGQKKRSTNEFMVAPTNPNIQGLCDWLTKYNE